jgi:tRNA-dihydrouridine synthase A
LRQEWVYRLKQESPQLTIILNGGVTTAAEAVAHLEHVDGVMLGRAAYHNPWILSECNQAMGGQPGVADRTAAVLAMSRYIEAHIAQSVPVKRISRHLLGLFQGLPGARSWRRYISDHAHKDAADGRLLFKAMEQMQAASTWQSEAGRTAA